MSVHRRAYVHIGLAKTGTTSIQYTMAAGRHDLLKQGFLYPRVGALNDRSGHHCLAWALRESPKHEAFCARSGMRGFQNAVTESADLHIIVSSEELSGISYSASKMRTLLSLFRNHETYVVAYVREQAEFFNAFWVELISDLNRQMSLRDFVQKCLTERRYDYNNWFKGWKNLLGPRLIIRPFDRAVLVNGNVVDDFCSVVGIDVPRTADRSEWKNRSLNANQIAALLGLLRTLERRGITVEALPEMGRTRLKGMVNRIVQDPELMEGESYWGIEADLLQRVRDQYCEVNTQFFGAHLNEEFKFSAVDRIRPVTAIEYEDLDPRLRARLEKKLFEEVGRLDEMALSP